MRIEENIQKYTTDILNNGYYLDIAEYQNSKVGFDFNKQKGIFGYAKEALKKGELLLAQKAIVSMMQKANETQKDFEEDSKKIITYSRFLIFLVSFHF